MQINEDRDHDHGFSEDVGHPEFWGFELKSLVTMIYSKRYFIMSYLFTWLEDFGSWLKDFKDFFKQI